MSDPRPDMANAKLELETWRTRATRAEADLAACRTDMEKARPKLPQPVPMTLDPKTTALLVLDLTNRCNDPAQVSSQLAPRVAKFLEKTRAAGVLTIYTIFPAIKDTPVGQVWDKFNRRTDEPVLWPDAFDKFTGGEIRALCEQRGVKTVIVTGASSNFAVLYTATNAARLFEYEVVIPVDGIIAKSRYEDEYTLYQFTVLPSAAKHFSFTTLEGVTFKK